MAALLAPSIAAPIMAQPSGAQVTIQPGATSAEAARAALEAFDLQRLMRDRAYAEEILRHVGTLDADEAEQDRAETRAGLRLMALAALERRDEAQAGIDRFVLAGSRSVQPQIDTWWSALILDDAARAVAVLEGASRRVRGIDWPELRRQIGSAIPRAMFARLSGEGDRPLRVRLAAALLRIGWPGDADRVTGDDLRMMLLEDRLANDDASGAAEIAGSIRTPAVVLPLIVLRRYDPVIGDRDRLAMFRTALAEEDRETAAAVAVREPSVDHVLARARYLRAVGRNAEAWALVEPRTREVEATVSTGSSGIWLIDQAVGILSALDRGDDALALNRRLIAAPLTVNSDLINVYINHIAFLSRIGNHAEALDHAGRIERDHATAVSAYGKMWISSGIVCALAGLGRAGEAAPVLSRMRAAGEDNPAAMVRAHLCLGDLAAAEAALIRRLGAADAGLVVTEFQTFELSGGLPEPGSIEERMAALRDRPAVRAALERVARTLRLPLAEYNWY